MMNSNVIINRRKDKNHGPFSDTFKRDGESIPYYAGQHNVLAGPSGRAV